MAPSVAIVGAGQIAHSAWYCLGDDLNIAPQVFARSEPSWIERSRGDFRPYELGDSPAPEADVVFDTIAFDAQDIERYDPDRVGQLIVVSSASVYCDNQGRTLDEAATNGFPDLKHPITARQETVLAGPETYSTRKVRMEQRALELFGSRATILRPCAIYGPHSRHPREWWFVKRMLDGRKVVPLAHRGESQFQTTNADLIGDFVVSAIEYQLGGIYNLADSTRPTVFDIGRAIAGMMGKRIEFSPIEEYPPNFVGRTPWSVPKPFIVDGSKAASEGHLARVTYELEVEDTVQWLADLNPADWRAAFPQLAAYPWDLFDYEAEDRFLASQ